jgi:L-glyceraldehyde 3-phosphate reductase
VGKPSLLDVLEAKGVGSIAFSPLSQGMLTGRYLNGVPGDSRAATGQTLGARLLNDQNLERAGALNEIAANRGQSLAQLAISWVLREERVTSALVGASSVAQLRENLRAVENLAIGVDELAAIDAILSAER